MDIVKFISENGVTIVLWLLAVLGIFKVFGKQIGGVVVKFATTGEKRVIDLIPNEEIKANAKMLIKQANSWFISVDGKTKFDWVVAGLCKLYPMTAGVLAPIAQSTYDEIKDELIKQDSTLINTQSPPLIQDNSVKVVG